jgi:hypothetical protein
MGKRQPTASIQHKASASVIGLLIQAKTDSRVEFAHECIPVARDVLALQVDAAEPSGLLGEVGEQGLFDVTIHDPAAHQERIDVRGLPTFLEDSYGHESLITESVA